MKKMLFSVFFVLFFVSLAFAQQGKEDVEKQIKALFPNFSVAQVDESPIPGLYEIVTKDGQIMYWSPKGYMIFGEIWTSTGKSITAERKQEIVRKKLESLDLSQAIKIGSGKNKIVTFTNPECPYCKRGYEYLSKRSDYTEYLFFLSFGNNEAKRKIAYVICSKDKKKAYDEVMSGKEVSVSDECIAKAEPVMQKHMSLAQSAGVGGTPTYVINGNIVYGANIPLIENILNRGK